MSTPAPATGSPRVKALLGALIALLLLVGVGGALVVGNRGQQAPAPEAGTYAVPAAATSPSGGLLVNRDASASAPTIDIYLDFQCPWCKRFHDTLDPGLTKLMSEKSAKVVLHLKTFLDSGDNDSSARVARAAACAADAGRLWQFQDAAFAGQPAQEGTGFTDAQIQQFAATAGITGESAATWKTCVADGRYSGYIEAVEAQSTRDGIRGTPTYRIAGKDADLTQVLPQDGPPNPQAFFAQVPAARS